MFANLLLQEMGLERIKYMYMFLTGHGHRVINGDKMEKEKKLSTLDARLSWEDARRCWKYINPDV